LRRARFLAASAEAVFGGIGFPPGETCVLIDPPRKGSTPGFLEQLAAFGPARIVYVSCNPATQIRDLTARCNSVREDLFDAEEVNRTLQIEIERAFSLKRVERIARERLGMVEPSVVRYVPIRNSGGER
jgi:hypothetical protein